MEFAICLSAMLKNKGGTVVRKLSFFHWVHGREMFSAVWFTWERE